VRYVEDDAEERGLTRADLVEGLIPVRSAELPRLFEGYDQVWCW
jgi:sulfur relay (sulfurtransferase) DsrF/TusC family protein